MTASPPRRTPCPNTSSEPISSADHLANDFIHSPRVQTTGPRGFGIGVSHTKNDDAKARDLLALELRLNSGDSPPFAARDPDFGMSPSCESPGRPAGLCAKGDHPMPNKVNDTDSKSVRRRRGDTRIPLRAAALTLTVRVVLHHHHPHAVEYAGKHHRESEASSGITRSPLQIRSTQIVNVTHLTHPSRTIGFQRVHLPLDNSCS